MTVYCRRCGVQIEFAQAGCPPAESECIGDPAFARHLEHTNRWSAMFSSLLAVASIIGFFFYGETGREMVNPQALSLGLGIGGMFLLIALYSTLARGRSKIWDGVVAGKTVKGKTRHRSMGNHDSILFCSACATLCSTEDNLCWHCGCPLLK